MLDRDDSGWTEVARQSQQTFCRHRICWSMTPQSRSMNPSTSAPPAFLLYARSRQCPKHEGHLVMSVVCRAGFSLSDRVKKSLHTAIQFDSIEDGAREAIWDQLVSDLDRGVTTAEQHLIANVTAVLFEHGLTNVNVGILAPSPADSM